MTTAKSTWPTSQDYNEAVQNPRLAFQDADLAAAEVVSNKLGLPVTYSGNFADVYQFRSAAGNSWAVKCFTRPVKNLHQRYQKISTHLEEARLPFTVGFEYLTEGIRIRGRWYPVVKMDWVQGKTLNKFIREHLDNIKLLGTLCQLWYNLAQRLQEADITHADLQHGNVLLVPRAGEKNRFSLKLVDYDGMYIPSLAQFHSGELGHAAYQHPQRLREQLYRAEVDRFSHLVIYTALYGLSLQGRPLWECYDDGNNLLFTQADFRQPGRSKIFHELWELNEPVLRVLIGHLVLSSQESLERVPLLEDLLPEGEEPAKLTAAQESQVLSLLAMPPLPHTSSQSEPDTVAAIAATAQTIPLEEELPSAAPEADEPAIYGTGTIALAPQTPAASASFLACPQCKLSYRWNGRSCSNCGYTTAGIFDVEPVRLPIPVGSAVPIPVADPLPPLPAPVPKPASKPDGDLAVFYTGLVFLVLFGLPALIGLGLAESVMWRLGAHVLLSLAAVSLAVGLCEFWRWCKWNQCRQTGREYVAPSKEREGQIVAAGMIALWTLGCVDCFFHVSFIGWKVFWAAGAIWWFLVLICVFAADNKPSRK